MIFTTYENYPLALKVLKVFKVFKTIIIDWLKYRNWLIEMVDWIDRLNREIEWNREENILRIKSWTLEFAALPITAINSLKYYRCYFLLHF